MVRMPRDVRQLADFRKFKQIQEYSDDDLVAHINRSGVDITFILDLVREYNIDQPAAPATAPIRKSRKKMNEKEKKSKKRDAVRKHRQNIKDIIENSPKEIERLAKISKNLAIKLKQFNDMKNQLEKIALNVRERMAKKQHQQNPEGYRLVPQVRQSGCG